MVKNLNKEKIVCIIQARVNSKRLPGKILMDIQGKQCIERVIDRVKSCKEITEVWLATTSLKSDLVLAKIAKEKKINLFKGSNKNVLSRFFFISKKTNANTIIRVTGDCPLIDPGLIKKGLQFFKTKNYDYVSNTIKRTYPDGLDVEIFSNSTLEKAYKNSKNPFLLEHVTPYIHGNSFKSFPKGNFSIGQFKNSIDYSKFRWTLDEQEDLDFLNEVYKKIDDLDSWNKVIKVCLKNPQFFSLNKHIKLNQGSKLDYKILKNKRKKIPNRYKNSIKLFKKAIKIIPSGAQTFSKSYLQWPIHSSPSFLKEGKGCIIKDIDNNKYIDYLLALMPIILGYANKEVDSVVHSQIRKGTILSLSHPTEVELSEKLIELIPYAEMVKFAKNGSDVLSAAVRLARAYTKRELIAVSGYHGWHDWYIGTTTRDFGIPISIKKLTKKFTFNNINSLIEVLGKNPDKFAAIIIEPDTLDETNVDFLKEVRNICNKYGIVLIYDEIICGFRSALGGASKKYGIYPDLGCFGKAMANGYPLSALVGKKKIMKKLDDVFISGTFSGEILSIVACLQTIKILKRDNVIYKLEKLGKNLKEQFNKIFVEYNLLSQVEFTGNNWWPRLTIKNTKIDKVTFASLLRQEFITNGLFVGASLNLCMAHQNERIMTKTLKQFRKSIDSFDNAIGTKNPEKMLIGKKIEAVFKIR